MTGEDNMNLNIRSENEKNKKSPHLFGNEVPNSFALLVGVEIKGSRRGVRGNLDAVKEMW
jgi:hypothetical protein